MKPSSFFLIAPVAAFLLAAFSLTAIAQQAAAPSAPAQETASSETVPQAAAPVAIVGSRTIGASELDAAVAGRGAAFGTDPDTVRQRVRDLVLAEHWVQQFYAEQTRSNPTLRNTLDEAARQILFQIYAQSLFSPTEPTDAEIEAFVIENPQLFGERVDYRFQRVTIRPDGVEAQVAELLTPLQGISPDETALRDATAALAHDLAEAGIAFDRSSVWAGSEGLSDDVRARLDALHAANRTVDISQGAGLTDVLVLYEARPAPVDPAVLRDEIAQRLLQARFQEHRQTLAAEIAAPLIDASATARPPLPPSNRLLVALAALGAGLGLVLAGAISWSARARQLFRLARLDNTDDGLRTLQRSGPVTALAVAVAALGIGAVGLALSARPAALLSLQGLSVFAGLMVLGLVLGLLMWRRREATLAQGYRRLTRAGIRAGLLLALLAGLSAAFVYADQIAALLYQ